MVNVNNNFNVIPWYSSLEQQNHRKWYAFDKQWPLIMPNTRFLPFQFVLENTPVNISAITVYSEDKSITRNLGITPTAVPNTEKGYCVVMLYPEICDFTGALPEGRYYATLTVDGETLYSEVFTVVSNIGSYLKLTYWNTDTLYYKNGEINYANDFRYEMYLDTTIGKPEYEFSEELTTRLGYKFLESQISNKLYKFIFLGPEFICDAMRLIRLSDYIKLESGRDSYNAISFSYEPSWETQGDLASIEVSFETDTIIQKLPSFNRNQRENFYNALLTSTAEPLLYDEGLIAQYYTAYSDAITGKLTRQLAEANVEEITEETVIPIDQGLGAAQQVKLLPLLRRYASTKSSSDSVLEGLLTRHIEDNTRHIAASDRDRWNTILDWFELRETLDGKKVLHSKYGIASEGELTAGGVGSDSGEGGSYSRLDSWDDYNPANGDVLSATLGYGLKTGIQNLQEQIDNMGGGGLSSVTVKIGNTAYDSVDGVVSLPSYPVVPTLLSEFTDDVVAGKYLPIAGGYFQNSLNYKSTSAYPLILGSTSSAEQSVILLRHNDVDKAQIGWSSSLGTYLYNTAAKAKLGVNNNGVAYFNDYTLYHTGNFDPADYLPKSGGVITSASYQPFILHRTAGSDAAPFVVFENDDKRLGMLGISAVTAEPVFYRDSSTSNPFTILHSGNIADYALPLSGGTIDSTSATALSLKAPASLGYTQLRIYSGNTSKGVLQYNTSYGFGIHSSGTLCGIYIADDSKPKFYNANNTAYEFLHEGNFNSYALPLSGGTLTNTDSSVLKVNSSATSTYIQFQKDGASIGYFGYVGSEPYTYYGGFQKIIHAGNIASQSVAYATSAGDAGTLGGQTGEWYQNNILGFKLARSRDANAEFFGILHNYNSASDWANAPTGMSYGRIMNFSSTGSDALTGQLAWDVNHGSPTDTTRRLWWRAISAPANVAYAQWHQIAFTDSNVASAYKLITENNKWVVYLSNVGNLVVGDNIATGQTHIIGNDIILRYGTTASYGFRLNSSGNVTIGASDLAGTTTKLYIDGGIRFAPRTIWGQSFDGTGNVGGIPLFNAYAEGGYISSAALMINKGGSLFGIGTASNSSSNISFGLVSGSGAWKSELMTITDSGNVLIGTTTDNGNKLQVNGNISATGSLTIGGAILTWDATYNCLRVNTNLATDGELTVGGVSDAAVVTEYDSATEIAELNRRITELENRLAAYEQ